MEKIDARMEYLAARMRVERRGAYHFEEVWLTVEEPGIGLEDGLMGYASEEL